MSNLKSVSVTTDQENEQTRERKNRVRVIKYYNWAMSTWNTLFAKYHQCMVDVCSCFSFTDDFLVVNLINEQ